MILIGVKSKYGSCKGTCMGWILINNKKVYINIYQTHYGALFHNLYIIEQSGSNPGMGYEKYKIIL